MTNFKRRIFLCARHVSTFVLFFFGNDLTIIGSRCKNYRASKMFIICPFLDCCHFVFITTLAYYLRCCVFLISLVSRSFQPSGSNQVKYSNNYKFKCLKCWISFGLIGASQDTLLYCKSTDRKPSLSVTVTKKPNKVDNKVDKRVTIDRKSVV